MDKRLATGTVANPLTARVRNDVQTDAHPLVMRTGALSKALCPRPLRQSIAGLRREGSRAPPPLRRNAYTIACERENRASSLVTSWWLPDTVQREAQLHAEDAVAICDT